MAEWEWKARLYDAIDRDERSARCIRQAAGLGPNYVGQMRPKGKSPGAEAVVQLCATLDVSLVYVFTGAHMTRAEEEVLTLFSAASDSQKDSLLSLLRSFQPADEAPE